ncbi:MAG: hypothetical protein JNG89_07215, partial [Planctomycetaceae bacterium]|nr:hypothetical protein [Planctomycetaceae bacterium]
MIVTNWLHMLRNRWAYIACRRRDPLVRRQHLRRRRSLSLATTAESLEDRTLLSNVAFAITGPSSVTEDPADSDDNEAEYTLSYTGTVGSGETISVDLAHTLNQTSTGDFTNTLSSSVQAAITGMSGVSFNGTTLSFTNSSGGGTPAAYAGTATQASNGDYNWSSISNATGSTTSTFAEVTLDDHDESSTLQLTNFGFSIPTGSTITGIAVALTTTGPNSPRSGHSVKLTKNGTTVAGTTSSVTGTWATGSPTVGGSTNLWGTTWTPSEINSSNFGLLIQIEGRDDSSTYRLDRAQVTVTYTGGGGGLPTSVSFSLGIEDVDSTSESNEAYSVNLSNSARSGAGTTSITTASAQTTIVNYSNDVAFSISGPASVTEYSGDGDNNEAEYTISFAGPVAANETVSVDVAHVLGDATSGDFGSTLAAAISAAAAGVSGVSFDGTTLSFTNSTSGSATVYPGTVTEGSSGETSWTNLANATGNTPSNYAQVTVGSWEYTKQLRLTNFGLNVPTGATINGIQVALTTTGSNDPEYGGYAQLTKNGTSGVGSYVSASGWSSGTVNMGGASNLWGATWTAAEVNAASFGLLIHDMENGNNTSTFRIYNAQVTVSYTASGGSGPTSLTFTLPIVADSIAESDEDYSVTLSNPDRSGSGGTSIATSSAPTTIINDSNDVAFSVSGPSSVTEDPADGDNNLASYTISYTGDVATNETVSVDVAHALDQTTGADFTNSLSSAINAAIAGMSNVSFNGTTLSFTKSTTASTPAYPATAMQGASGDASWTNLADATGNNAATYAQIQLNKYDISNQLRLTNFGLNIPSTATINGISVSLVTTGSDNPDGGAGVSLTKDGTSIAGSATTLSGTWAGNNLVVGSASSLWNTTWTPAQVNASTFGVLVEIEGGSYGDVFRIYNVQVTVSYTTSGGSAPTSLTFTLAVAADAVAETSEAYGITLSNSARTGGGATSIAAASAQSTIVNYVPPNQAPEAVNDSAATAENTPLFINVLANDTDPESSALTLVSVTQPSHGSAEIRPNVSPAIWTEWTTTGQSTYGSFSAFYTANYGDPATLTWGVYYVPGGNYNGSDSFSYTIADAESAQDAASVSVTVAPKVAFSITGPGSVTEDPADADENEATYTISYSGAVAAGETVSVDVVHVPGATNSSDFDSNLVAAILSSASGQQGISFNGTTLSFTNVASGSSSGFAGTASQGLWGDVAWTSPAYATGNTPADYANATVGHYKVTKPLRLTAFGLQVPANATINGISVALVTTGSNDPEYGHGVSLTKNGSDSAGWTTSATGAWSTGGLVVGGATNLWGTTWTPAQINSPTFGVVVEVEAGSASVFRVYTVQVTVSYTTSGMAPASLTFNLPVTADSINEPDEAYQIELRNARRTGAGSAAIASGTAATTIINAVPPNLPPEFSAPVYSYHLPQDAVVGAVVGSVAATDPEEDAVSFSAPLSWPFQVHASTGQITLLDRTVLTVGTTHTFTVNALDADGSSAATVSIIIDEPLNHAPEVSGLHLVYDTATPGDLRTSDPRIQGTLTDVEGTSTYYDIEFDFDVDGVGDDWAFSPGGTFQYDPTGFINYGTVAIRARGREWNDLTSTFIYGSWQTLTFTYEPATPNVAPQIADPHLVNDTATAGDLITADARLAGTITDANGGGVYFIEVDTDGDGLAETSTPSDGNAFELDLSDHVSAGAVEVRVRPVEWVWITSTEIPGDWVTFSFTYVVLTNSTPTMSSLTLVNDTGAAGDLVTTDPRWTLTLSDAEGDGSLYFAEIDVDEDGIVDDAVAVTPGQAATFDPLGLIEHGELTVRTRAVEYNEEHEVHLRSDWSTLTFTYALPPNAAPTITALHLIDDTQTPADLITTDARIGGGVSDSDATGYEFQIELDIDGDEIADDVVAILAGGSFEFDVGRFVAHGVVTAGVRALEWDSERQEYVTGPWSSLTFTYADLVNDTPTLDGFGLVSDTGTPNDDITADPRVSGTLRDSVQEGFEYVVQFDFNDDGVFDHETPAMPDVGFTFDPRAEIAVGAVMIAARVVERYLDAQGEVAELSSGWTELEFTYAPSSGLPVISGLNLVEDTGTSGDGITSHPRITGHVGSAPLDGALYGLEFDVNGDGYPEDAQSVLPGNVFEYDPTRRLSAGAVTIGVRVTRTTDDDRDAETTRGAWAYLSFTYAPVINLTPDISGLHLVNDTQVAGDRITSDPEITGSFDDVEGDGLSYLVQVDVNNDGVADDSLTAVPGSSFTYDPSALISYGARTVRVRAVELLSSGPSLTGTWRSITFTWQEVIPPDRTNVYPVGVAGDEDAVFLLSGARAISVRPVPSNEVSVTLTAEHGTLTVSGNTTGLASLSGNGTDVVVLTGSVTAVNTALSTTTLTPAPDFYGTASVEIATVELNPGVGASPVTDTDTFELDVRPVNDAPTLVVPGSQTTDEDVPLLFTGATKIQVGDVDSGT